MSGANARPMKPERFAINALGDKRRFLAPLLVTPDIGMAVLDNKFRFQVVNHALAATNGIPVKAHIGKTVHHVLGPVAKEVEPRLRRAFATGRSEIFETVVKMPTRSHVGHWIQTYIPLRDSTGNAAQVCAIVLEVTAKKKIRRTAVWPYWQAALSPRKPEQKFGRSCRQALSVGVAWYLRCVIRWSWCIDAQQN